MVSPVNLNGGLNVGATRSATSNVISHSAAFHMEKSMKILEFLVCHGRFFEIFQHLTFDSAADGPPKAGAALTHARGDGHLAGYLHQ